MKPGQFLSAAARFLAWACLASVLFAVRAEPFVPRTDQQVLERVRMGRADPATRELGRWRAALAVNPNNLDLAVRMAERCVERSRIEGDPRYLGHAQAALAPWWAEQDAPVVVQVLRATIEQSQHDFTGALVDLDHALKRDPNSVQAWLTRATVLTVLGRYDEARAACRPLFRLAPPLAAVTALANVASLNGEAERSRQLLRTAAERSPSAGQSEKTWAWTVLAEINARLGHAAEADADFRRALALDPHDLYLRGAFADFLLDHNRAAETIELLQSYEQIDALLLRLALAQAALDTSLAALQAHIAALQARIEASRMRGDCLHRREQARFELHLRHRPAEALRLAEANWAVQREPADARLLLESAVAAKSPQAAMPVIDFVRTNRLEDVQLRALLAGAEFRHLIGSSRGDEAHFSHSAGLR
jgi:tetratricopeptide (TPR) repeat protein